MSLHESVEAQGPSVAHVQSDFRRIGVAAATTLSVFVGLVVAFPAFEVWTGALPSPGRYQPHAGIAAVLLSALLAYREVQHQRRRDPRSDRLAPSGRRWVVAGTVLALAYLAMSRVDFGVWADWIRSLVYGAILVLLTYGFVVLAKKAYDAANENAKQAQTFEDLRRRTIELQRQAEELRSGRKRKAGSGASTTTTPSPSTRSAAGSIIPIGFVKFATGLFAAAATLVAGFGVLNQIVAILPPVVQSPAAANALGVLVAVAFIGSNYTSEFLEKNLSVAIGRIYDDMMAQLQGRNVVEAGLRPVAIGILCLIALLAADTALGGRPSSDVGIDTLLTGLEIVLYTTIAFGLWRLGVGAAARLRPASGVAQ